MSTPNDTRSPITDALETLGMIHFKKEKRDAIHLAVEPVTASCRLRPGERIGIVNGYAYPVGYRYVPCINEEAPSEDGVNRVGFTRVNVPYQGIVDPFLTTDVQEREKFWFVMKPREVRSLRHVWEHPDFPAGE